MAPRARASVPLAEVLPFGAVAEEKEHRVSIGRYTPSVTEATTYKSDLIYQLQSLRESVLWKLEGLSEYDLRRPLTPTGTNLLGLVKHLASCEFGYFGEAFARRPPVDFPWLHPDAPENADMWATPAESKQFIVDDLYRRSWEHAAQTFDECDLDSTGRVPWWRDARITLHQALMRMIIETARHAGHADIVRETIDGSAGLSERVDSLPYTNGARWRAHVAQVQAAADAFR